MATLSSIITPTNITTASNTQTLTNKTITGGILNGTLGATTPSTGKFSAVQATNLVLGFLVSDASGNITSKTKTVAAAATGGTDVSTTSSTLADVTGMSVTMTTSGGKVLVLVSFPMKCTGAQGLTTINFDGVDGAILSVATAADETTVSYSALYSPSAASHTWKLRFRNSNNLSTISMNMSSVMNGSIIAIELPY